MTTDTMNNWNTEFPPLLSELHELEFDYADGEGIDFEPYSEFLSAEDTRSWFRAWTGNEEIDGAQFRVFGQDGTGGYAAFWLVEPAKSLLEQPVVFIGSEGEAGVVAANFHDYLWLLAAGIGHYEAVAYPGLARQPNQSFTDFAKQHSPVGPLGPEEVLEKANDAHPEFEEGIRSLCR